MFIMVSSGINHSNIARNSSPPPEVSDIPEQAAPYQILDH
jgi:hypothetical protein